MKIVVAHESIDTAGGVEAYLGSIIPVLQARGHQVSVLYQRRRSSTPALALDPRLTVGIDEEGLEVAMSRLRIGGVDVCFSHNMGRLDVERRLLREWPVVKMMHGYFGTCVSGLKAHAFPTTRTCERRLGAACLALYVPRHCGHLDPRRMLDGYRFAVLQRKLLSDYSAVIVASRHMGGEFERHGASLEKLHVVPLFSTLAGANALPIPSPDTVLFAGRMTALKGGHVLIAAVAAASKHLRRPIRLVMAGDGPQKEEWRQLASRLGVAAEFAGWIAANERSRVYGRASLLAVPSLWPEPFGLVGLEAASLRMPAVAFDVGGIREWLHPGTSGVLVAPHAGAEGLGRAIAALLADEAERSRLGNGALAMARQMSLSAHVDRLEGILQGATLQC